MKLKPGTPEYNRARMKAFNERHPLADKSYKLKAKYGLTLEQYHEMVKAQDNLCAICQQPEMVADHRTGIPRALAVDHCHKTGKVRGLLCTHCNKGLGHFNDNVTNMARAIEYLTLNHEAPFRGLL
jgi:hypothetical protein